jgi:hypothetical protein
MPAERVTRADVTAFRLARHQLDLEPDSVGAADIALLDIGVQDTGHDGSSWALAVRGARQPSPDELVLAWTIRGAPHAYRRAEVAAVTTATAPLSEADAASRIYDAARPLRANGIAILDALVTVAKEMRSIAAKPVAKGEMSAELTARLGEPFLRACRPCNATHVWEQPFRLAALQAGLELEPGTSPPVLRRIPGVRPAPYKRLGSEADAAHHVVRGYLRFFGPAPLKAIAAYLDAPAADVKANLPDDVVEVDIERADPKQKRYLVADDLPVLQAASAERRVGVVRLVGSHDPYLQLRDRELLVDESARQKDLWRVIGRPGAVLVDGEVVATWRPRSSGKRLSIAVDPWTKLDAATRRAIDEQAQRLAAHRGVALAESAFA